MPIEDIIMEISDDIFEIIWQNENKGYGYKILVIKTTKDCNSVETVKSLDSDVH